MTAIAYSLFQFAFVGNGKFLTTLSAARCEHCTSIGRLHTFAKTVYGFTATPVWLECTFHLYSFLFCRIHCQPGLISKSSLDC